MIAFLSARPLRLRSFAGLVIGRHSIADGNEYRIVLAPEDTKNGRPYETPIPARLAPYLKIYVEQMRPILVGEHDSDRLWISVNGANMSEPSISHRLCKVTDRELGRPINPHLFRDCAMTSRAIDDPSNILAMTAVLGHGSIRTSEKHYNQGEAIHASRQYQRHIVRKRQSIKRARQRHRQGDD
jgi:integrase